MLWVDAASRKLADAVLSHRSVQGEAEGQARVDFGKRKGGRICDDQRSECGRIVTICAIRQLMSGRKGKDGFSIFDTDVLIGYFCGPSTQASHRRYIAGFLGTSSNTVRVAAWKATPLPGAVRTHTML